MSAEAIVGTGITIGALGLMCVLLGSAQWMRGVDSAAWILLGIGVVMLVGGGITAALANSRPAAAGELRPAASDGPAVQTPNQDGV